MYSYETCTYYERPNRVRTVGNTHQVHTVSCTADQADVADRVQGAKFIEWQALVHEVNRHEVHRSEPAVNTADEFVNNRSQILVLFNILPRRHSELSQNNLVVTYSIQYVVKRLLFVTNLANPFRMLAQEELQSVQLLRNTFDVVQPIDTDNNLHAPEALL